jgi:hypothetical protein
MESIEINNDSIPNTTTYNKKDIFPRNSNNGGLIHHAKTKYALFQKIDLPDLTFHFFWVPMERLSDIARPQDIYEWTHHRFCPNLMDNLLNQEWISRETFSAHNQVTPTPPMQGATIARLYTHIDHMF